MEETENVMTSEELHQYVTDLVRIIKKNSPKRDDDSDPHVIKRKGRIVSPFPGNLKKNGNQIVSSGDGYEVKHGYEPAEYALYANARSRKPKYIEESIGEFAALMASKGWEQE